MIFPNRPGVEIRPGMGVHPGANPFGYVAHIGYAGGARSLGAVSSSQMQAALDQGLDPSTLNALSAAGATDSDIAALMVGDTDVPTLMARYAGLKTTETTSVTSSGSGSSTPAPAPQIPSGSTLLYTVDWTAGIGNLSVSTESAIAQLKTAIASHGLNLINGQATSTGPIHYEIEVTIQDTIGHNLVTDAKSILDSLMAQIVGANVTGSNLSIVQSPGQAGAQPGTPTSSIVAFLESNALLIGVGVIGLALLMGGRRR
jgi:hypothetical protein